MEKLISICIPSYNRPHTLMRLLKSIDCHLDEIEILICEDLSPRRLEIREVAEKFKEQFGDKLKYIENQSNHGYDKNLSNLLSLSTGRFTLFMGDDDWFVPGALDKLQLFLKNNMDLGYVLKRHNLIKKSGTVESFRYFDGDQFFNHGEDAVVKLFRRSVFISGFCINTQAAKKHITDQFDGTLIIQLFWLSQVLLEYKSAYFDHTLSEQYEEEEVPWFGSSETERGSFEPGIISVANSVKFLEGYNKILNHLNQKNGYDLGHKIKKDMSKYFYPSLAIQRKNGMPTFLKYLKELKRLGFGITPHYYIYVLVLAAFGKKNCDFIIVSLKKIIGRTPQL